MSISYYNATLTNSNQLTYSSIPAEFNQVFDNSLIDSAKNYDVCVTRFCLSSQSIPFWSCPIQLNQPNPNLTPYGIQLSYKSINGNEVSLDDYEYLLWSDSNNELPPEPVYPAGNITRQIMSNGYYFSYDKQEFIRMFNLGMSRAFEYNGDNKKFIDYIKNNFNRKMAVLKIKSVNNSMSFNKDSIITNKLSCLQYLLIKFGLTKAEWESKNIKTDWIGFKYLEKININKLIPDTDPS
jgi:hypothetical protein